MVMDQFVTNYRKDYLWPYVKVIGTKPDPQKLFEPTMRDANKPMCQCHCLQSGSDSKVLGPNALSSESWSRQGPMGPLLDPKLYPAKVGRSPEAADTMRFNQPNVFLKKLQDKYPYIYEVLRTAPPDDLITRINKDRLRTTYQVDFCGLKEYPAAPYDELLRSAGVEGLAPCSEPVRLPGDPCRPNQKPIACRPNTMSKAKAGGEGECGSKCGSRGIEAWDPFDKDQSKYDKNIRTWGKMLYRDPLHAHGTIRIGRTSLRKK